MPKGFVPVKPCRELSEAWKTTVLLWSLTPNLAGLAETKEGVRAGQQASVYIKSIIPEKMKIKLIIIDTFDYKYNPKCPEYYCDSDRIDRFVYSPENCRKRVETIFDT